MNKNRVRELREARHLSQERLGEFTDISQQVISGIECSDSCLAKDDMIILADFFEVSTDYLLGGAAARGALSRTWKCSISSGNTTVSSRSMPCLERKAGSCSAILRIC